jgi:hypothetical protein
MFDYLLLRTTPQRALPFRIPFFSRRKTVLKGIVLEAGKPWAASLRQQDVPHGMPGGQAHPPAREIPIHNRTP